MGVACSEGALPPMRESFDDPLIVAV